MSTAARVVLFIIGMLIGLCIIMGVKATRADAPAAERQPALAPWFAALRNKDGDSCCDGYDGFGVNDLQWRVVSGRYEVVVKGKWTSVLPGEEVDLARTGGGNLSGKAIVWPRSDGSVRCFMPGPAA